MSTDPITTTPARWLSSWREAVEIGGERFSAAWLKLRAWKLARTPWCELCAKTKPISVPAIDVDHILRRHSHLQPKLVLTNLQSLCIRMPRRAETPRRVIT